MLSVILSFFFFCGGTTSIDMCIGFHHQDEVIDCGEVPEMNKKIVEYIEDKIGKKMGRGECWDVAAEGLRHVNASWDGKYKYGTRVNPEKDCVFPGDMIQFEGVKLKYQKDGMEYTEKMAHHTAMVYKVLSKGVYELAHQNTGFSGRKVGISKLDISTVKSGSMKFFRPTK